MAIRKSGKPSAKGASPTTASGGGSGAGSARAAGGLAASASSGFLYLIGRAGVTGAERGAGESSLDLVARARRLTDLPLAVGFGISESAQVAEVTAHADLAIVGSALVDRIHRAGLEGGDGAAVDAASEFMDRLMQGIRR